MKTEPWSDLEALAFKSGRMTVPTHNDYAKCILELRARVEALEANSKPTPNPSPIRSSPAGAITPPPELVQQLCDKAILHAVDGARRGEIEVWLIQEAFRAGADQELEACCSIALTDPVCGTKQQRSMLVRHIRERRRPKPPSLKELALAALHGADDQGLSHEHVVTIRRALEALPND